MTGSQRHATAGNVFPGRESVKRKVGRIPGGHQQSARVGVGADAGHHRGDLVNGRSAGTGPAAPLVAVDGAKPPVGGGPFVPDADPSFLQPPVIRRPGKKPQELVDDAAQMDLLLEIPTYGEGRMTIMVNRRPKVKKKK